VTEVTITDPHHALYGQRLELVSSSSARGPRHVTVALADGRRRSVRRAATDLGEDWPDLVSFAGGVDWCVKLP
jgi:hypothetical protein